MKEWFATRRLLFSEEARRDGISMPKGAIIFGMGGTGKDWAVENLAQDMGWTTLFADFGAAKGPLMGQSHRQFREILETAEAQAPCHLVVSEIEKMLAGAMSAGGGAALDGGVSSEIFATFLNWMQRKKAPIFVWGLTNEIASVSQPMLRAGRWDKIWFMDLPYAWEREEIFRIHLRKAGWDPDKLNIDIPLLSEKTDGYTGAEIETIVQEGLINKFVHDGAGQKHPVKTEHLLDVIPTIPSTMKMRPKEVDSLRKYAKDGNISFANSPQPNSPTGKVRGGKVGDLLKQTL